ncbi:MAG: GTPase RsgA, partial [Anaerolineaceae bacterium]|nr:GTPase RsgA [Anaerolineaceae bacterium]
MDGLVIRLQAGFYSVDAGGREITCRLRGRLKKGRRNEDIIAVGDRVRISLLDGGSGVIEEIYPREKEFSRMAPLTRGEYKQILLANPDQVLLVFSCMDPEPSLRMLDRFLVITEKEKIPVVIVANKIDLVGLRAAKRLFSIYTDLGYKVLFTSAKKKRNINQFKKILIGKVSVLSGPSG